MDVSRDKSRLITLAIHTMPRALAVKVLLEREGIDVAIQNVNLKDPVVSSGVRVRIHEEDLPRALRVVENPEIFDRVQHEKELTAKASKPVVLLPIDFSSYSRDAAFPAFALAAAHKAKVVILHSFVAENAAVNTLTDSLDFDAEEAGVINDRIIDRKIRAAMNAFARRLREDIKHGILSPAPFETKITQGLPEDAINDFARELRPLIIVMGTRGASKKERELIGSVTAEVLDTCRFPVYAVPEEMAEKNPRDMAHAVFFATPDQQDIVALDAMMRLFKPLDLKVTLVTLPGRKMSGYEEAMDNLLEYCKEHYRHTVFNTRSIRRNEINAEIENLDSGNHDVDFICVPNKKKNIVARFFNPTLAHRILFHGDIPMLVIPV